MINKLLTLVISLFALLFLAGCIQPANTEGNVLDLSSNAVDFTTLVETWNTANSARDAGALAPLYTDNVNFYGTQKEVGAVLDSKKSFFRKNPDFIQTVVGTVSVITLESGEKKCSFMKRVKLKGKETDYPSYLVYSNVGGSWKISTEGDEVTDANLAKRKKSSGAGDKVQGDFNGDGQVEEAWLVPPKINEEEGECVGECIAFLRFSNPAMAEIAIRDCIGGVPDNLGDLNGDGSDEIGLLPSWFTSCWREYYVWTLKYGNWKYLVDPIITHCNLWDEGLKPIEPITNKFGYVTIHYSEHQDDEIVTLSKSVPVN